MFNGEMFEWYRNSSKNEDESFKKYPFEGCGDILRYMFSTVTNDYSDKKSVLDIGSGTTILTELLYEEGAEIFMVDTFIHMVEGAKEKMPKANFLSWDFRFGFPDQLKNKKFDYIISSYSFSYLNSDEKVKVIKSLNDILNVGGKIIVGDVAFETYDKQEQCKRENINEWEDDETYIIAEQIIPKLKAEGINAQYMQVSSCAGILLAEK